MATQEDELQQIRARLIALIESDDWRITETVRGHGRELGYWSEWSICKFVLERLKVGFPMNPVLLGEPPGSSGTGYSMTNADGEGLYIKLKIEDEEARVLSFHTTKHSKKG